MPDMKQQSKMSEYVWDVYMYWWFFLKEFNTFIQQVCIKLIKSDSKYMYSVTKDFFQINAVF